MVAEHATLAGTPGPLQKNVVKLRYYLRVLLQIAKISVNPQKIFHNVTITMHLLFSFLVCAAKVTVPFLPVLVRSGTAGLEAGG